MTAEALMSGTPSADASSQPRGSVIEDQGIPSLLTTLRPHLPYSLPLYRRLQFQLKYSNPPHAHAYLIKSVGDGWETLPWLAAHIDLTNSGQTQVWVYASWEKAILLSSGSGVQSPKQSSNLSVPPFETRQRLFSALFSHFNTDLIPQLPDSPPAQWLELERTGKWVSKPYSRFKVLFGAFDSCLFECLPHQTPGFISRSDKGYNKYIFAPPNATDVTTSKDSSFTFAPLAKSHLQTVLDRTPIPRTLETLSQLPSIGLFHTSCPTPIGWGFLGKDASLSSLHTEPEFRGKGLAVLLSEKLFDMQRQIGEGAVFCDGDQENEPSGWCHADVSPSNNGSIRVMEKLGGEVGWVVCWVEVDLAVLS